jgi:hypothetical protein
MFGKVFHRTASQDGEKRRFRITMSSKKPIDLKYIPKAGEQVLLAKETTIFKGEISVDSTSDCIQCSFEGENLRTNKNSIHLDIDY